MILQLGARMYMAGSLAESMELVQQAAESNRKDFRSFVLLGNLRDKSALYSKAAESYKIAIENSESDRSASLYLPSILERLLHVQIAEAGQKRDTQNFTEARQAFANAADTAARLKEFDPRAEMVLADIQFQMARCDIVAGNRDSALRRIGELAAAHDTAAFRLDDGLSVQGKWLKQLVETKALEPAKSQPSPAAKLTIAETLVQPVPGVIRSITAANKDRFWVATDASWAEGSGAGGQIAQTDRR